MSLFVQTNQTINLLKFGSFLTVKAILTKKARLLSLRNNTCFPNRENNIQISNSIQQAAKLDNIHCIILPL